MPIVRAALARAPGQVHPTGAVRRHIARYGSKPMPTGKKTRVYHQTTAKAAEAITTTRKWKGAKGFGGLNDHVFASTGHPSRVAKSFHGGTLLAVDVPRQHVKSLTMHASKNMWVAVHKKHMDNLPVKTIKMRVQQ